MKNVLYYTTITPADESDDGETPTRLYVTEEANGWAVIIDGLNSQKMLRWFPGFVAQNRNAAIEYAVDKAAMSEADLYHMKEG